MTAKPFTVNISKATLEDLRQWLTNTRWTDEISGADWNYGSNLDYMKRLVEYWRDDFDWPAQEAIINRFAHFRADVDGVGFHYIHERGKGEHPLPIILTHGFPHFLPA